MLPDITGQRLYHEIYLNDARKTEPKKLRTVIRHPIRKKTAPALNIKMPKVLEKDF